MRRRGSGEKKAVLFVLSRDGWRTSKALKVSDDDKLLRSKVFEKVLQASFQEFHIEGCLIFAHEWVNVLLLPLSSS